MAPDKAITWNKAPQKVNIAISSHSTRNNKPAFAGLKAKLVAFSINCKYLNGSQAEGLGDGLLPRRGYTSQLEKCLNSPVLAGQSDRGRTYVIAPVCGMESAAAAVPMAS